MKVYDYRNAYKNLDRNARKSVNDESYIIDLGDGRAMMVRRISSSMLEINRRLSSDSHPIAASDNVDIDSRYYSPANVLKILQNGGVFNITAKTGRVHDTFMLPKYIANLDRIEQDVLNGSVASVRGRFDEFSKLATKSFSGATKYFDTSYYPMEIYPLVNDAELSNLVQRVDFDQIRDAFGDDDLKLHINVNLYTGVAQISAEESDKIVNALRMIKSVISKKKSILARTSGPMQIKIVFANGAVSYDSVSDMLTDNIDNSEVGKCYYWPSSQAIADAYFRDIDNDDLYKDKELLLKLSSNAWEKVKPQLLDECRSGYRDFVNNQMNMSVERLIEELTEIEDGLDESISKLQAMSNIGINIDASNYIVPIAEAMQYIDDSEFVGDYELPDAFAENIDALPLDVKSLVERIAYDFSDMRGGIKVDHYAVDRISKLSDSKFTFNLFISMSRGAFAEYRSSDYDVVKKFGDSREFNKLYFSCSIDIDDNVIDCKRVFDALDGVGTTLQIFINRRLVFNAGEYCGDSVCEHMRAIGLDPDAAIAKLEDDFRSDRMVLTDEQICERLTDLLHWEACDLPMIVRQYHPNPNESYEFSKFKLN